MSYTHERNYGCRLMEYVYRGLKTVTLENEQIRISILADKGTDIFEFLHKPSDTDFMWRSPLGVRNPALFVASSASPKSNFLDHYEGGWQESFPSGNDPCTYKGAEFGLHGEVSGMPWDYRVVEDDPEQVAVRFWVRTYRTPFLLEKTITLQRHSGVLEFRERVTNEGDEPMDLMWGQHVVFGPPFLSERCVIDLPGAQVSTRQMVESSRFPPDGSFDWPLIRDRHGNEADLSGVLPPSAKTYDAAFLQNLADGWYAVTNQERQVGIGLRWPTEVYPYIWLWQSFRGGFGYPFYGRTYNLGLELFTSIPFNFLEALEQGTTVRLEARASLEVEFRAIAFAGIQRVAHISETGEVTPQ